MSRSLRWLSAAILMSSAVTLNAETLVDVGDAYIRMPIPGKDMSAAFMTLHNGGSAEQKLVSASADWAKAIEIHTHIHDHATGTMQMRQIEMLPIPAGETVTLQPGGLHLMLFGLASELPAKPEMKLCFADGHCQQVNADVRDMRL